MKKILITGASGIIGTLLTQNLSKVYDIVTLDLVKTGGVETDFSIDISDRESLDSAISSIENVDFIIHLAANASEKASWEDVLKNNIIGTRNIYDCAQKHGVKRVIFASSTHPFGKYPQFPDKPGERPIPVEAPHRPDGFYGISKGFGEDISRYYYDVYGLSTIVIRIGNVTEDNKPLEPDQLLWLSYNDTVQIFSKALTTDVPYGTYFAISRQQNLFDVEPTKKDLGFSPECD